MCPLWVMVAGTKTHALLKQATDQGRGRGPAWNLQPHYFALAGVSIKGGQVAPETDLVEPREKALDDHRPLPQYFRSHALGHGLGAGRPLSRL